MKKSLFLLFLPALMACEGTFDQVKFIQVDPGPPQLVLLSDFENIYSPKVRLTVSGERPPYRWGTAMPIPEDPYPEAPPATLEVFEDGRSLGLMVRDSGTIYRFTAPYVPVPGKTYRLEANAEGFPAISAEARVPEIVPLKAEFTGKYVYLDRWGRQLQTAEIRLTFPDIAGQNNFYGLYIHSQLEDMTGESTPNYGHQIYSSDILFERESTFSFDTESRGQRSVSYGKHLFTDQTFDGKTKEILFYMETEHIKESGLNNIYFILQHMSEDSYKYQYTRQKARQNSENPFVQPILIHSNVKGGGLGILGSYSVSVDSLRYP